MIVQEAIQQSGEELMSMRKLTSQSVRNAIVGIVDSYDPETQTVSVQPAVMEIINGAYSKLPLLNDVPVFFPGGAELAITYPIKKGDECLVILSDTCIDSWFVSSGVQVAASARRHSLSDGFAIVGFRSKKNQIKEIDTRKVCIYSKSGDWKPGLVYDPNGEKTLQINVNGTEVFSVDSSGICRAKDFIRG